MFRNQLVLRPGRIAMDRREELGQIALADLEAAASAWFACATVRELFLAQSEAGPVSKPVYDRVALGLADDFDQASASFRRSDGALRREEHRRFGLVELVDPKPLVAAIETMRRSGLDCRLFAEFARQLGGAPTIALLDQHGFEWVSRFLGLIGCPVDETIGEAFGRSDIAAGFGQKMFLRAMFVMLEGEAHKEPVERRLEGHLVGRYGIADLDALDELTAWKAIVRMRERISAYRAEAA